MALPACHCKARAGMEEQRLLTSLLLLLLSIIPSPTGGIFDIPTFHYSITKAKT